MPVQVAAFAVPQETDRPNQPVAKPREPPAQRRTIGIIAAHSLAIGLYGGAKWWDDGFSGSFRSVNEGWFGRGTYAGGADKLGHFYINYASTRLLARAFEWAGDTPGNALALAAWTTAGTYAAVEVLDGLSRQWSFSREDAIINLMGVGAAYMLEKNPELDRLLDIRILYRPSNENGERRFDPFGDYSGQTYLLVAKASGIPALRKHGLLRFVELAVGYNARGFSDTIGGAAGERARSYYVGISLNLSELLSETAFKGSQERSRTQRVTESFLEFVQVPGTAALVRRRF